MANNSYSITRRSTAQEASGRVASHGRYSKDGECFDPKLKPVYEDHIKNVATQLGVSVQRADDFFSTHTVMEDIWAAI